MTIEQQALDLVKENKMLLAENKALDNEVKGYRNRVCSMCDGHGLVGNCIDSMDCPDCTKVMNSVKADAIEALGYEVDNEFGSQCGRFIKDYADKLRST